MNAVEYQRRATLHKPTDADSIAVEVRRLKANGYSVRDISGALNLDYVAVEQMLHQFSPGASIDRRGTDIPRRASTARPGDFKT